MIFRNDDITGNTNLKDLREIYNTILSIFPNAEIWSGITLFSQVNPNGSVYLDVPFKDKETNWFYKKANDFTCTRIMPELHTIASHGLYHIDHSNVPRGTQEMSILGSCAYLNTKIFVPPFNRFNQDTLDICFDNGIRIETKGWKSLEHEIFDSTHEMWYFHSWKWNPKSLRGILSELRTSKNS